MGGGGEWSGNVGSNPADSVDVSLCVCVCFDAL